MNKIAIITDSNSGITQQQAKEYGVSVIPMPFYINDQLAFEGVSLSQEEFYQKLGEDMEIHTSQPAPADLLYLWDKMLKTHDSVVFIPMSSGLSSACQTAAMLALDYEGRVQVVDNRRVSVTQRQSVLDALELAKAGKSAEEIKSILEKFAAESSIYITLETLHYLKKGGRITPAAAAIGAVLGLKPVLQISGEKLDAYQKVRGKKAARDAMIAAMQHDLEEKFKGVPTDHIYLAAAYSGNLEEALDWKAQIEEAFPDMPVHLDPLSLSVSCHIGPGSLAIACSKAVAY